MAREDDDRPAPAGIALGADLSRLSLAELDERLALLRQEIDRVESAIATKRGSRSAADALFRFWYQRSSKRTLLAL